MEDIQKEIPTTNTDPLVILEKLIPKVKKEAKFPLIKLEETKKIIKELKNSNSSGMDNLTNKIIRKAPERMAEMHTHLINQIIKKKKFPEILKISKIIPISKKGKPKYDIDSFRSINNLACTEKIIEEWIKVNMEKHINENEILNDNHHGGRKTIVQ